MFFVFIIFLLILTFFTSPITSCENLNNVSLTVRTINDKKFDTIINGCIERSVFVKTIQGSVKEIHIKNQNITELTKDSIRHLVNLEKLTFSSCGIKKISKDSWRNLPNLKLLVVENEALTQIPEAAFSNLWSLDSLHLHRNRINAIESGGLGYLPKLKWVHLPHNFLVKFEPDWFTNTTNLEFLDFRYNKIRAIPKAAFNAFFKIRKILFDFNEIESIHAGVFGKIPKLEQLGLTYNRLRKLDPRIFPNPITIDSLEIGANFLNYLPKDLQRTLTVKKIYFSGNPWHCPCLDLVSNWLNHINATIQQNKLCQKPFIPVCAFLYSYATKEDCKENVNQEITTTYLKAVEKLTTRSHKFCFNQE